MEYVIPYLRIDELMDLSKTCKEYRDMIDHYFGTKKKYTIKGTVLSNECIWLMRKMKSLTYLIFDCVNVFTGLTFNHLPVTLETLIMKDMAHILWNSDTRSINWNLPCNLYYLLYCNLEDNKKVFSHLKHIEVQVVPRVSICCLYDPVVDGYDEYGPKYDYNDDYLETDELADCIPFHTFYKRDYKKIYDLPKDTDTFPALERFILPEGNEHPPTIRHGDLKQLPWPRYKPETT